MDKCQRKLYRDRNFCSEWEVNLDFIQPFKSPVYMNAFLKELEENGIAYDLQDVMKLELPDIKAYIGCVKIKTKNPLIIFLIQWYSIRRNDLLTQNPFLIIGRGISYRIKETGDSAFL